MPRCLCLWLLWFREVVLLSPCLNIRSLRASIETFCIVKESRVTQRIFSAEMKKHFPGCHKVQREAKESSPKQSHTSFLRYLNTHTHTYLHLQIYLCVLCIVLGKYKIIFLDALFNNFGTVPPPSFCVYCPSPLCQRPFPTFAFSLSCQQHSTILLSSSPRFLSTFLVSVVIMYLHLKVWSLEQQMKAEAVHFFLVLGCLATIPRSFHLPTHFMISFFFTTEHLTPTPADKCSYRYQRSFSLQQMETSRENHNWIYCED